MSLLNTYKLEIRTKIPNPIERDEWRFTRYGLLTAAKEMTASPTSIITTELKEKALISEGRELKVPVSKIGDVTIKSVRSCQIGDLENETELVTINWVTLVADISMKKSEHHKNELSYLEDLNKKILRVDHAFSKAVEQLIYSKLDAEKSQVNNSPLVGAGTDYPIVGNTIQVPLVKQEYFFNDLEAVMEGDDFYSMPFKVLGSTTLKPAVKHWGQQGQQNDENLAYQFDGYDFRFSNHVTNGAVKATGFIMEDGSLGIMSRIGIDSQMKNKAGDGTEWGTIFLDKFGFEVGTMYKSKCDDLSGQAGLEHLTASMVEQWQLSIDIALVTPYNSDAATLAGGIKKFEFLTT